MRVRAVFVLTVFLGNFFLVPVVFTAADEPLCNAVCRTMRKIHEESPNVVFINVSVSNSAVGTGTIISVEDGTYILTNNHVIEGSVSGRVWVIFESGNKAEVEIAGRDTLADLALLKAPELPRGVIPVKFGDSPKIGQQVYVLGYPFGVRSITFGYINALDVEITWPFIWMQAPLNPGNSGGPLFNEERQMVGVNTAVIPSNIAVGGGIGLVMPIDYVKRLLGRLVRERVVRHGIPGFNFRDSTRLLPLFFEQHGLVYRSEQRRILVVSVQPGSFAAQTNIRVGDTILKWNGVVFANARSLREKIFFDHRPGDEVRVMIQRGEQTFERTLRLSELASPKQ